MIDEIINAAPISVVPTCHTIVLEKFNVKIVLSEVPLNENHYTITFMNNCNFKSFLK